MNKKNLVGAKLNIYTNIGGQATPIPGTVLQYYSDLAIVSVKRPDLQGAFSPEFGIYRIVTDKENNLFLSHSDIELNEAGHKSGPLELVTPVYNRIIEEIKAREEAKEARLKAEQSKAVIQAENSQKKAKISQYLNEIIHKNRLEISELLNSLPVEEILKNKRLTELVNQIIIADYLKTL